MNAQPTKREQNALRKDQRNIIGQAVRASVKGSGWRFLGSYSLAAKDIGGVFTKCRFGFTSLEVEAPVRLECAVKPMAADPLFWEIQDISGNNAMPLSFRATGAHTCAAMNTFERQVDGGEPSTVATEFRAHLEAMAKQVSAMDGSFADRLAAERDLGDHRNRVLFETHALALLLEERWREATSVLEDGLARNLSSHYSFYEVERAMGMFTPTRPFAEMALIWLDQIKMH